MTDSDTRPDTPAAVVLVKQPHGGALIPGGPKNRSNTGGRPPSWIRAEMRKNLVVVVRDFERALKLKKWPPWDADNGKPLTLEQERDIGNFLARYGVGMPMEGGVADGAPFTVVIAAAPPEL